MEDINQSSSSEFEVFDYVDSGVVVIRPDRRSTIAYCNRLFAKRLGVSPKALIGRSLDEISVSARPHYEATKQILMASTGLAIIGGRFVRAHHQLQEGKQVAFKLTRIKKEKFFGQTYLVGYLRKPTRLEWALHRSKLDTSLDPYWKPVAEFFLSGKIRPWLTATSPLWLPYLISVSPDLAHALQHLFFS